MKVANALRSSRAAALVAGALALGVPAVAAADDAAAGAAAASSAREAAKHFERGVALYREMDYPAALVEFKRANALAPNATVLYNIGQAQYQLQDYAGALATFTRYLVESSPGDGHRAEVEGTIEILRSRVGHVSVTTSPTGADVTIDDQPVGKTPLADRVLVSVGRRKITASLAGHVTATRFVEVAADDSLPVALDLPATAQAPSAALAAPPGVAASPGGDSHGGGAGPALRVVGWVATGVLAAGAITSGVLALREAHDLANARGTFPVSRQTLDHDSKLTLTYSVVADTLGAAAIVVGGVTLFSTLTSFSGKSTQAARLSVGPGSARLELSF